MHRKCKDKDLGFFLSPAASHAWMLPNPGHVSHKQSVDHNNFPFSFTTACITHVIPTFHVTDREERQLSLCSWSEG